MCSIGKYIQIKSHSCRGGQVFVSDERNNEYLLDEKLLPKVEDRLGMGDYQSLRLFIIDENRPRVTQSNHKALIHYFYSEKGGKYRVGKRRDVWEKRWRQTVIEKGIIDLQEVPFSNKNEIGLPRGKEEMECDWFAATWCDRRNTPVWVMPVFAPILRKQLNDHKEMRFVPTDHYWDSVRTYSKHSFFTPNNDFIDGMERSCEVSENEEKKTLRLVLHGFFHPATLHHKFWCHVLGQDESVNEKYRQREHGAWEEKFADNMPNVNVSKIQKFRNLDHYQRGPKSFRYSDKNQFNQFHQSIRKGAKIYLEQLSLLFLSSPTTLVQQVTYDHDPDTAWCMVNMLPANEKKEAKCLPFLAMEGMSYNWNNEEPVLHLHVKTFFLKFFETNESMLKSWKSDHDFQSTHPGAVVHEWRSDNAKQYS